PTMKAMSRAVTAAYAERTVMYLTTFNAEKWSTSGYSRLSNMPDLPQTDGFRSKPTLAQPFETVAPRTLENDQVAGPYGVANQRRKLVEVLHPLGPVGKTAVYAGRVRCLSLGAEEKDDIHV